MKRKKPLPNLFEAPVDDTLPFVFDVEEIEMCIIENHISQLNMDKLESNPDDLNLDELYKPDYYYEK